ncbi:MAG: cupin domain-containing protein [Coriobacteriia bacterium]|nr:cupin domain-containing protein [Coriobacteriia bacterium]
MTQIDFAELGQRIKGLREACDVTCHEMAEDLGITVDQYRIYEETGADVPISVIFHMSQKFGIDMTEILTGVRAKLDTYQVVRRGEGREVDRLPGYAFEDLAWLYSNKVMQPLLVTLDPDGAETSLVTHSGQEFNMVLEGTMEFRLADQSIILGEGDCIYFNSMLAHGQSCASRERTRFVTVIAE